MEQYFELPTHRIVYRMQETPGKEKVLFLHGLGANLTQFEREYTLLSKDYSVATLSLRGQGNSTRPSKNNPQDMTIRALATDVIQWIEANSWEKVHVVACSMGGVVALEILKQNNQLLKSLIIFGTTPKLYFPKPVIRVAASITDLFLPMLFPTWMAKTLPKSTTDKPEAQQRFTQDLLVAYTQRRTIYQLRCELAQYDYTDTMQTSPIPLLMLQGEKDTAINKEIEKLWPVIKENPLVSRKLLTDAGHIANYDQPEAFYQGMLEFLKGQAV